MLNETNRDEVIRDVIRWLDSVVSSLPESLATVRRID